jgi:FecR protein
VLRHLTRPTFFALASSLILLGGASADPWHIERSSGLIWLGFDTAQLASLGATTDVPGGATLMTGQDGRALLVRGTQTMLIGPDAVVTVPDHDTNGITTIIQRAGEITFDVDREAIPHFAVETPYLAAVVKGTHFTVHINDDGADVSVERGLVGVTDLATGEIVDTPSGQSAKVSGPDSTLTVSGSGQSAVVTQGSARAPLVTPLTGRAVRSLQTDAMNTSNGAASGLLPIGNDSQGGGTGLTVVAASSGGNNDGGASGSGGGTPSGGAGGEASRDGTANAGGSGGGALARSIVVGVDNAGNSLARNREPSSSFFGADGSGVPRLTLAAAFGFSVLLAVGIAFLRARLG